MEKGGNTETESNYTHKRQRGVRRGQIEHQARSDHVERSGLVIKDTTRQMKVAGARIFALYFGNRVPAEATGIAVF